MGEVTELLEKAAIFRNLDADELTRVADVCKEEKCVSRLRSTNDRLRSFLAISMF